jgi:hypothetical protein
MDTERNIVISGDEMARMRAMQDAGVARFERLPDELQGAAERTLAGRRSVKIAKTASEGDAGELARFAAEQRKKKRAHAKKRRGMEKATKRAQRKAK